MKRLFTLFTLAVLFTAQLQAIVITMVYYEYNGKMYFGTRGKPGADAVPIKGAHIPTFEVLKSGYAKDKRNLYYCGIKIQKKPSKSVDIDASGYVIVDNKTVYYEGKRVVGADAPSFHIYNTLSRYPIAKDKKQVYKGESLASPDATSLEQINNVYFKDRNGIYCAYSRNFGEMLKDAALGDVSYNPDFTDYLISNGNVYYRGYKTHYKAEGFRIFDHYYEANHGRTVEDVHLFRSGDSIYIGEQSLDLDVESFQMLGKRLAKDKNGVYRIRVDRYDRYYLEPISELDPSETRGMKLRILGSYNSKDDYYFLEDGKSTYVDGCWSEMANIDWDTFEPYLAVESRTLYKDKNTIYTLTSGYNHSGMMQGLVLEDLHISSKDARIVSFTYNYNLQDNEPLLCLKDDSVAILFNYRQDKVSQDVSSFRFVYADNEGAKYKKVVTSDTAYLVPVPDKLAKYADKHYLYNLSGERERKLREGEYEKLVKQSPTFESWEQKRIETLGKFNEE